METINTYYTDFPDLKEFVVNNKEILLATDNKDVLVQVFSGICDKNVLVNIAKHIGELVPGAQVIGTTTNGEIMNGEISGLKTVVSFSIFKQTEVKLGFAIKEGISDFDLGRTIASKLDNDKARVLILFATGLTVNASQLLKGVQSVNDSLPVAGGNAGDNLENTRCFVFTNDDVTDCGVVAAALLGDSVKATRHSHLGWQAIGKEMTVTRAAGSRIYTIDNLPAYQMYRQYLASGEDFDIINSIEFPLLIEKQGQTILRVPFFRYEDDSLGFFGDIDEGERVRFSFGHIPMITDIIESLLQSIRKEAVESIFVYSCAARRSLLGETAPIETQPMQMIAPTSGFFTSGEFFHANNSNQFLNNTMTILALSESDQADHAFNKQSGIDTFDEKDSDIYSTRDNVANRSIGVLRALTTLVRKVTDELNERSIELEKANGKLQYNSSHDALTGLYNRGFLEQEIRRVNVETVGIIICDVDGLKMINDSFGHSVGDELLKTLADILESLFKNNGLVARMGGDEFAVLLKTDSQSALELECQRIREAINVYNNENPAVPLSVSVGSSFSGYEHNDVKELFMTADDKMYREKLERSQSIRSDLVQSLMSTLQARDIVNEESSQRFLDLFISFAIYSGIDHNKLSDLRLFARFHDIGKVGISDQVLFSPYPLSLEHRKEMEKHCEIGYRIARSSTDLLPIANWIMNHHEWWDGRGYPLGLAKNNIPLECRILAVVKAFDEMTNDRPYRVAMSIDSALEELRSKAGTQFDPVIADAFTRWFKAL